MISRARKMINLAQNNIKVMNFLEAYPGSGCEYTSNNSSAIEPFPGSCSEYNPSSTSSEAESNPEFSAITPKLKKKKLNSEFDTPPENFCKRQRRPSEWKKNKAKYLKNHGMDHYNKKGQFIPKKELKKGCKETCRMRCSQRLSKDIRTQIFQNFYKNGSKEFQWAYIANLITLHKKKFAQI
ncbi:uncharacterized protein LOC124420445 [Lucilia cuprina]|uniref:uncharacterized protein LOC124420445 n=1 Tax=Lucilia cuprina TaxID=7375 RepID=UPI001F0701FB|nr:uncharacterized protein LOC124420445 [Lucilia cuprina]